MMQAVDVVENRLQAPADEPARHVRAGGSHRRPLS